MEMTRYLRAPSLTKLLCAAPLGLGIRRADAISSGRSAILRGPRMKSDIGSRRLPPRLTSSISAPRASKRRHAVRCRRGVAQVAADGAAILDLPPADFACGRLQAIELRGQATLRRSRSSWSARRCGTASPLRGCRATRAPPSGRGRRRRRGHRAACRPGPDRNRCRRRRSGRPIRAAAAPRPMPSAAHSAASALAQSLRGIPASPAPDR